MQIHIDDPATVARLVRTEMVKRIDDIKENIIKEANERFKAEVKEEIVRCAFRVEEAQNTNSFNQGIDFRVIFDDGLV